MQDPSATPVVVIAVDRGLVYVNGAHVPHAPGVDPEEAALAFVAAHFAAPLGRPVRALLTSAHGHARLQVAPDGTAVSLDPQEPPVARRPAAAPRRRSPRVPQTFRPPRDRAAPAPRHSGRPRRPVPMAGALATAVVALLAAGSVAVVVDLPHRASGTHGDPGVRAAAETERVLASPSYRPDGTPRVLPAAVLALRPQVLVVRSSAGAGILRLTISRLRRPARAVVRVDGAAGLTVHRVEVTRGRVLSWAEAPGVIRWTVRVPGAAPAWGSATVAPIRTQLPVTPPTAAPPAPTPTRKPRPTKHPYVPTAPVDPDVR